MIFIHAKFLSLRVMYQGRHQLKRKSKMYKVYNSRSSTRLIMPTSDYVQLSTVINTRLLIIPIEYVDEYDVMSKIEQESEVEVYFKILSLATFNVLI